MIYKKVEKWLKTSKKWQKSIKIEQKQVKNSKNQEFLLQARSGFFEAVNF